MIMKGFINAARPCMNMLLGPELLLQQLKTITMKKVNFDNYLTTINHTYQLLEMTQLNINGLKHFSRQCELTQWYDLGCAERQLDTIKSLIVLIDENLKPF